MEQIDIRFDDALFDELVHSGLPECGDLTAVVKDRATEEGKAAVVFAFTAVLPSGERVQVQAVTTGALVEGLAAALAGRRALQSENRGN
jgi:hypothetical protein